MKENGLVNEQCSEIGVCVCGWGGGGGGVFLIQKSAFQSTVLTGLSLVDGGRHA